MRFLVVSDILGNYDALKASLNTVDQFDVVLNLGNSVYFTKTSIDIVKWMQEAEECYAIQNVTDSLPFYENYGHLASFDMKPIYSFTANLPESLVLPFDGHKIMMTNTVTVELQQHDRKLQVMTVWNNIANTTAVKQAKEQGVDVLIFGGLNKPFVDKIDDLLILSPGSVGLPLDRLGDHASFVVMQIKNGKITYEHHRVQFDQTSYLFDVLDGQRIKPKKSLIGSVIQGKYMDIDYEWPEMRIRPRAF